MVQVVADSLAGSKEGYKLSFKFAENEWFEDALLTKEVNFVIDGATGSQTCTTSGSSPKWKKQVLSAQVKHIQLRSAQHELEGGHNLSTAASV